MKEIKLLKNHPCFHFFHRRNIIANPIPKLSKSKKIQLQSCWHASKDHTYVNKIHEKSILISHNWVAMIKHAKCLKTHKQKLPSLNCMPFIHTSLYRLAIFTTRT